MAGNLKSLQGKLDCFSIVLHGVAALVNCDFSDIISTFEHPELGNIINFCHFYGKNHDLHPKPRTWYVISLNLVIFNSKNHDLHPKPKQVQVDFGFF